MTQSPHFRDPVWQKIYDTLIKPALLEHESGRPVPIYHLKSTAQCPDGLEIPDNPRQRLCVVRIDVEGEQHLIADTCNAISRVPQADKRVVQMLRHALGSGDEFITRATLVVTFRWLFLIYPADKVSTVLSAISISGPSSAMPSPEVIERLAACSTPGDWLLEGVFKDLVQHAHREALRNLMKGITYQEMTEFESKTRARGRIDGQIEPPYIRTEIGNCGERPVIQWLFAMARTVVVAEARSSLTIKVVTIRKRFISEFIALLEQNSGFASMAFFTQATALMGGRIGKQLRVPPCWRCRLCFSFAKEAQAVTLNLLYDDKRGWHPIPTWTLSYLREFFRSEFAQTGALLLLQGEVEQ
ncbi:hypothetical protein CALCODRAFT_506478 [Calocera cornea HHB12733]|uniref:Uncharacterized protein n=1 Tax=Calocera cornea HHB12733 TaxID=1353952 RepID=A0A165IW84_9BASI|nr:hypothetical protein CALCODRAFT_506478 [Calocera cornea HHB12733]